MRISDWSSDVCSSDLRPVEDGLAFPVPLRPHVVVRLEERRVLAEQFIDLGLGPDVELAFLAFAVAVAGSGEGAGPCLPAAIAVAAHLAQHPAAGPAQATPLKRRAGVLPTHRDHLH